MQCPFCGKGDTRVVDSREAEDATRRRRECEKCGKRFTTYERLELELMVVKKDGKRELFDHEKLKTGIMKACQKRPVAADDINEVVGDVEKDLKTSGESEVPSKEIGKLVMKKLKKLDKVAYIRFASVYREFQDVEEFAKEAEKLT